MKITHKEYVKLPEIFNYEDLVRGPDGFYQDVDHLGSPHWVLQKVDGQVWYLSKADGELADASWLTHSFKYIGKIV